jgi:general secretion pathway protein E
MAANRLSAAVAETGQPPAVAASLLGLASEEDVAQVVSRLSGAPAWAGDVAESVIAPINESFLASHYATVLSFEDGVWQVGLVDPTDTEVEEALAFALGQVRLHTIPLSLWRRRLRGDDSEVAANATVLGASWTDDAGRLRDFARDTPAVRMVDELLERAFLAKASDVHVEQKSDCALVRFRIDGFLRDIDRLGPSLGPSLIARIKVLCDLDVASRRAPQDGRTTVSIRGAPVDVRVSTTPTLYGESLVVRLLHRRDVAFDLDQLGFSPAVPALLSQMLERPHGLILVTGPTGSGKTTTLYAALRRLVSERRKILTIEDPVEYVFEPINQTQVNEAAGVTFASALRSFLRHDPDVILVGEIRDSETARLAVQAGLTGHLVLATLHTNDAVSAPARLADMGVERYLLAGVLIGAVAQRLAPSLCPVCAGPAEPSAAAQAQLERVGLAGRSRALRKAPGCASCDGTGRAGRTPIGEAYRVDETFERMIVDGAATSALRSYLMDQGFSPFERDAVDRALAGDLDLDEALRIGAL